MNMRKSLSLPHPGVDALLNEWLCFTQELPRKDNYCRRAVTNLQSARWRNRVEDSKTVVCWLHAHSSARDTQLTVYLDMVMHSTADGKASCINQDPESSSSQALHAYLVHASINVHFAAAVIL